MRLRNILIVLLVLVVGAVVAGVVYVSRIDFNQYRGLIAEQAKAATGRELKINGELKLALGFTPAVAVDDVSFANAPWGTRPQMAQIKRFEAEVELLPLISGDIRVKRIVLVNADILLETDPQGRGNWVFDTGAKPTTPGTTPPPTSSAPAKLPVVKEVVVRDSKLVYRDGKAKQMQELDLQRVSLRANSDSDPLKIDVDGAFNGHAFQVNGQVGAITALTRGGTPFPVSLVVRSPEAGTIKVDGQIKEPMIGKGYELAVAAEGNEVAKVAELGGIKVPAIGPFKAEMKLSDTAPGGNPSVPSLKVDVGKPELVLVRAQGAIKDPLGKKGIALTASIEGREIGAFSGLTVPGMAPLPPIPALGPFRANVKVTEGPAGRPAVPELKAEIGKSELIHAVIEGAIQDPLEQRGINIAINADSQDLAALGTKMGTEMPVTGPMSLQARVSDVGQDRYSLSGVKLNAGGSDVSGEATVAMAGGRPNFTANFASNLVDLTKVGGGKADGKPAPAPAPGSSKPSDGRVFSNDPLPYDMLNMADGELKYRAAKIVTTSAAVQNLNMTATIRGGEFTLRPLTADIGGGKLNTDVALAAKGQTLQIKADTKGVSIGSLLQESKTTGLLDGAKTDINVDVRGHGPSMRAVMASLDGTVVMVSGEGTVHTKYLDLFGGDVLKVINPLTQGADTSKLNCIASRFEIKDGLGTTKVMVTDTQRTSIMGEGTFNLGSEQLKMTVTPKSKDASLLSLTIPIRISGTFANPSFLPDHEAAAKAVAGSVGGALMLGPAGILVPFMSEGTKGDVCATAIATATGQKVPASAQTPQRGTQQPSQQQQQQQQQNPVQDLGRNLRGLFGK